MSACNRLNLQALGSQPVVPKNPPDHCHTVWSLFVKLFVKCCLAGSDAGGADELAWAELAGQEGFRAAGRQAQLRSA